MTEQQARDWSIRHASEMERQRNGVQAEVIKRQWAEIERNNMKLALQEILFGARNQGAFSGMSWQQVEKLCKAALS